MKVLLVSHVGVSHGAGGSLVSLALALRQRGDAPLVVVPEPGTLLEALAQHDIKTAQVKCPWWVLKSGTSLRIKQWYLRRIVSACWELARLIRRFEPALVHTNSAVIPSGALAAYVTGVPHIWHLREHVIEHYRLSFVLGRSISLYLIGSLSRALIAISESVATAHTVGATVRRMHVVYNGVDLPSEATSDLVGQDGCYADRGYPVLVLVGTLHPAKGQDEAIQALAELHRRGIFCQLRLIGTDAVGYRAYLEALSGELGIAEYVTFTGHLHNPLTELAQADVALICSRCEGFGRATVEAMLLRRPVVAANTCGTVELIEDGHTGLLYRQGDPIHLADRIEALLSNPGLSARLGDMARDVAQNRFSVDQYASSVIKIYEDVLSIT
jgi:glycosyltransferase involved in cell wall biosynthesis